MRAVQSVAEEEEGEEEEEEEEEMDYNSHQPLTVSLKGWVCLSISIKEI